MASGQRNAILGIIALVAFGAAGFFFFRSSRPVVEISDEYQVYGQCLACQHEGDVPYPSDEIAPFECPSCSEMAVYPLFYCNACGKVGVPVLDRSNPDEPPRLPVVPIIPVCRACRSNSMMQYSPQIIPEAETAGRAPLPEWP